MKYAFLLLITLVTLAGCTKETKSNYIVKNCCNADASEWLVRKSMNADSTYSFFFLPQVFTPDGYGNNNEFTSIDQGVATYDIIITLDEEPIWSYTGAPPIKWDGNVATSLLAAESGVYTYNLTATFANGEVYTGEHHFCLIREFAKCPEFIDSCVLGTMFDINDTTAPHQYIKETAVKDTRLYQRCD